MSRPSTCFSTTPLVAQDAVVQQREGAAFMDAQERRAARRGPGRGGFAESDMGGEDREADIGADMAAFVEHRRP
jgi:hypothetical protein